jgi:hypothetical protein
VSAPKTRPRQGSLGSKYGFGALLSLSLLKIPAEVEFAGLREISIESMHSDDTGCDLNHKLT